MGKFRKNIFYFFSYDLGKSPLQKHPSHFEEAIAHGINPKTQTEKWRSNFSHSTLREWNKRFRILRHKTIRKVMGITARSRTSLSGTTREARNAYKGSFYPESPPLL